MIEDVKHLPAQERVAYFRKIVGELVEKTDVEAIPTLGQGVSALVANITLIDLQDDKMLERFGRTRVKKADDAPINPRAN